MRLLLGTLEFLQKMGADVERLIEEIRNAAGLTDEERQKLEAIIRSSESASLEMSE